MPVKQKVAISLQNIVKDYPTGETFCRALNRINIDIYEGEFVAIMGPSGSGKSTTMHIMGGLDMPTSGKYFLNDKDISNFSEDELAEIRNRQIGFIFQSFNLLPRTTVLANVERPMLYAGIGTKERHERALQALRLVGIADKAESFSNKISGGQTQRVAIARALVMNPAIILADEPTGNLDSHTAHEIMAFLKELNQKGHTIVLITHEQDIAAFAKRAIHLKDGQIISDIKKSGRSK